MARTNKKDFVEVIFAGKSNGRVFDTNIPEELKKLNPKAEPKKTIVCIGENMVIPGLDKALEDKEIGKNYEIEIPYKEGFGQRNSKLIKTIPLSVFAKHNVNPRPGEVLFLDNAVAKVITVSGARVITDFNNQLAGKDLKYEFKIARIINDEKEKSEAFFDFFFKTIPEFEISEKVMVKGSKQMESLVNVFRGKFKELTGRDLEFSQKS